MLKNEWIDAHCHLADSRLSSSLAGVMSRSRDEGVVGWVQGGVSPEDWNRQLLLREQFGKGVIPVFGLHPWWVARHTPQQIETGLSTLAARISEARALGELGLDFSPRHTSVDSHLRQQSAFRRQLLIAKTARKSLILHVVKAHSEAIAILKENGEIETGGLVHAFSASRDVARHYLDLGLLISVGGSITKSGFSALKEAIAYIPSDRLVIETDSPDQTPVIGGLETGDLNEPRNLSVIAQVVAEYRKTSKEAILKQSTVNLTRLWPQ